MERLEKQQFVRRIAAKNQTDAAGTRVYWSRHAILETVKDDLSRRTSLVAGLFGLGFSTEQSPATCRDCNRCK